ncbi:hypothetical protein NQZ68_005559 [Dissostichus eleginoides]|nr:hypothetical protein NQZ68_005559 [Dissostichus eleginoides]
MELNTNINPPGGGPMAYQLKEEEHKTTDKHNYSSPQFYHGALESIPIGGIANWSGNCSARQQIFSQYTAILLNYFNSLTIDNCRKSKVRLLPEFNYYRALKRVVHSAERTIRSTLLSAVKDLYTKKCSTSASLISFWCLISSIMLFRALLQTSLVLWLTQKTLQGGYYEKMTEAAVRPQRVAWGRMLPARGVGVGVKPGGALGAMGNRYGTKAMKTGIGRYAGAQPNLGAALGTGMGLGTGLPNGMGMGLGQGGKRVYGAGLGIQPGYGSLAGMGYQGVRPGASAAELGGPMMANLGHAVQDLKKEKSIALGPSYADRNIGHEMPNMRRGNILTASESQAETGFRPAVLPHGNLNPLVKASHRGPLIPLDKQSKGFGMGVPQGGERYDPTLLERRGTASRESTLAASGVRHQLPLVKDNIKSLSSASARVQGARDYDSSIQHNQQNPNCASNRDLLHALGINHHELLGSETQSTRGLLLQAQIGKDGKHLGSATPQAQEETTYQRPISPNQDGRDNIFSLQQGQGSRGQVADGQGVRELGLVAKDKNKPRIRGAVTVENHSRGSLNLQTQGTQRLGITLMEGQETEGFTADGQKSKHLSHAEHDATESKSLGIPGQTGRNDQATSYMGGAGNYLGASLGAGGYGAAAAAPGQGYGEGATGHLGPMAGNGYGYGNGYGDGLGAVQSYLMVLRPNQGSAKPSVQEAMLDKSREDMVTVATRILLSSSTSVLKVPKPPTNMELLQDMDLSKQLGATQDVLGEQAGKYDRGNAALGNGYKG